MKKSEITKIVHRRLLKEHFGKSPIHPAYEDPESDMGVLARKIAKDLHKAHQAALAEAWDTGYMQRRVEAAYDRHPSNPFRDESRT